MKSLVQSNMALRKSSKEWILKVIFFCVVLLFLKALVKSPLSAVLKTRELQNRQQLMESSADNEIVNTWSWTKILGYSANKYKSTSKISKIQNDRTMISKRRSNNSGIVTESIYGSDCPSNPHKQTLKYLFHYWMALDNYYNLSSFLCGGSLIGSLRDGDLIPYDRDIDVCVTWKNYQKVRVIRSEKPFNYRSSQIFLAVQEDFSNKDERHRTRVDCMGRTSQRAHDPCSFKLPGARLISRGVYVDVFVYREHDVYLRDHEYQKDHVKTDLFPLKHCMFMDIKAKCPRNEMTLLLKYYKPDVLRKPHYKCQNKTWVATGPDAKIQFKIWFNKRLTRLMNSQKHQSITTS